MKWLSELVESSHSSLEVLPVPCLCEFLIASYQDQLSGGHAAGEGETDPSSHRAHYKRKKTVKDKVCLASQTGAGLAGGGVCCLDSNIVWKIRLGFYLRGAGYVLPPPPKGVRFLFLNPVAEGGTKFSFKNTLCVR